MKRKIFMLTSAILLTACAKRADKLSIVVESDTPIRVCAMPLLHGDQISSDEILSKGRCLEGDRKTVDTFDLTIRPDGMPAGAVVTRPPDRRTII